QWLHEWSSSLGFPPQINTQPRRLERRDHDRFPALTQFRVAKHNFVTADWPHEIANWGFADARAVDPDLRPRLRIQTEGSVRDLDLHTARLSRGDVHGEPLRESEVRIDEVESVISGSNHQPV